MKILNFGSCNIDYVYHVREIVEPGETISSLDLNLFPGGKGLNQSIAVARSGKEVYHAGCIGKDGMFLKEILEKSGVDTKYLKVIDGASGHAIIQVDDRGENCIILHGGANRSITEEYIDEVLENFGKDDIVILQNEISNPGYIIDAAFNRGMKIVLNPSPIDEGLMRIDLSKVHLLILNKIEAFELSQENEMMKQYKYFMESFPDINIVMTLGSKGSVFMNKAEIISCEAYTVPVVDTTAAGDTFLGYFVSAYSQNKETSESLKYASMAAALAVSKQGAATSIPCHTEVMKAIK